MTLASQNSARLEARIPKDLHHLLKRAAELQGRTMTDFVIAAIQTAARQAVEEAEVIRLSRHDQAQFAEALLNQPSATPALERAFARHRQLIQPE